MTAAGYRQVLFAVIFPAHTPYPQAVTARPGQLGREVAPLLIGEYRQRMGRIAVVEGHHGAGHRLAAGADRTVTETLPRRCPCERRATNQQSCEQGFA